METSTPGPATAAALIALCDDVFFALTAARRLDLGDLQALAVRRRPALEMTLRGTPRAGFETWEPWLYALCAAIAPISPPHWMPMAGAVDAGLSLEHGARGFRALFTSEPSEKNIARVRVLGSIAVRALGAVLGADGTFSREDHVLRAALIASLGLPEQDRRLLDAEAPLAPDTLDLLHGMEAKVARSIVRGSFYAAMSSGLDPREEAAVAVICRKLGVGEAEVVAARAEAGEMIDNARPFGEACVEAVLYMLEGDPAAREMAGFAAARLTLPPIRRVEAVKTITVGLPITLTKKHHLDRVRREAALALAWIAGIRRNPTYAQRAELSVRHDHLAVDLGELSGRPIREGIDRHLDDVLCALLAGATPAPTP